MIYFFRAISNESDDFLFDLAMGGSATFLDLHQTIQQHLNFDATQMTSFFLTDEDWQKEKEITLLDMSDGGEGAVMDAVKLEDLLTAPKQRLLYAFDLFAERVLFMELTHITEGDLETPRVVRLEGTPPPQFAEEAFDFESEEDFMDDDLYADELGEDFPDDFSDDFPDMGEAPEDYY